MKDHIIILQLLRHGQIETLGKTKTLKISTLSRIGIMGRVHMTNERLKNLTFLAFESKVLENCGKDDIWRHFNITKNRRLQIC